MKNILFKRKKAHYSSIILLIRKKPNKEKIVKKVNIINTQNARSNTGLIWKIREVDLVAEIITGVTVGNNKMGIKISLILVLKVIADIKDPTDMIEHVPSKIIKIKLTNENTTWILKKIKNGIKNKSSAMIVKIMIEIILLKKTVPRSIGAASQLQIASWFFSK